MTAKARERALEVWKRLGRHVESVVGGGVLSDEAIDDIEKALTDYADEKLEEAAQLVSRVDTHFTDDEQREWIADAIRSLKDGVK